MSSETTGTAPIVRIPSAPGRDHALLALLPISAAASPNSSEPVTLAYELQVGGRPRRVAVTLTPGSAGMPTHADQMVFLAALQVALRSPEPGPTLNLPLPELVALLGWEKQGAAPERIDAAMRRLAGLVIEVQSGSVARDGRQYDKAVDIAHVVDRYRRGREQGASRREASVCRVEWGAYVREAFRLGDFKRLDWDLLVALGNPLTGQLYRLLDRVTLSGQDRWEVGWQELAAVLGMNVDSYSRPARFRQVLQPHVTALQEQGVIDSVDYLRGGVFVFHVRHYLRSELRRVLAELGVFEEAARQLLEGRDEVAIMVQCDCLQHGNRSRPASPGGYLVEAVREGYELRYPDDDAEKVRGILGMLSEAEAEAYHTAAVELLGRRGDLFDDNPDPAAWSTECRAVVRFLVAHGLDPEQVVSRPAVAERQAYTSP